MSDSELVARVLRSDREAFSQLVRRHSGPLSATAFARLRNVEDARDAVQESFVVAYCSLSSLDDPAGFGAWMRGILLNCCKKHVEKVVRRRLLLPLLKDEVLPVDPHPVVERRFIADELHRALDRLSEPHREVVLLYYFHDTPTDKIAEIVGKPAGTVKRILSEARGKLQEDLIEMARHEFTDYGLTDEQRARLDRMPVFPREEPRITTEALTEGAPKIRVQAPRGNFPKLEHGSEAFFADYDFPSRRLTGLSHVVVQGPFDVNGKPALRYDDLTFSINGKVEGVWRPYFHVVDDVALYCAKQFGAAVDDLELVTSTHPLWEEPEPQAESLVVSPSEKVAPMGDRPGSEVDDRLWRVCIGRRSFECVRRVSGGGLKRCAWLDTSLGDTASEEFFLPDGRLLLWRRYNGPAWSASDPRRPAKAGSYEHLQKSNAPSIDVFGIRYHLWYDQLPDYALAEGL
jgi:RNA polymerase sigma-70 factor (ECF subfamily)